MSFLLGLIMLPIVVGIVLWFTAWCEKELIAGHGAPHAPEAGESDRSAPV